MGVEIVNGVLAFKLDMIATTCLALLLLMMGYFLKKHINFFEEYCFPVPVIGGFIFAILVWLGYNLDLFTFELTTTLQAPFMLAFFTTVGLGGSFALLKLGGKALLIYLFTCWFLAVAQNVIGVSLASLLGIPPVMGVMAGAVSLEGGHGAAATFGSEVAKMGIQGADVVALACATFGLVAGNLTGGPMGRKLITRFNIPKVSADTGGVDYEEMVKQQQAGEKIGAREFLFTMAVISVMMVIGVAIADWVKTLEIPNLFLPAYVGAMFGAIIFRNINDKTKIFVLNTKVIDIIMDISIAMFLSMAMMNMKLWQLADLALPIMAILAVQVVFLVLLVYFVLFRLLGRDYDAAIMCAGMMGHGLGATPNAVANMNAVCEHFGVRSTKAFLIVPLCGAVLIDLVAIPCIIFFIGLFT